MRRRGKKWKRFGEMKAEERGEELRGDKKGGCERRERSRGETATERSVG